MARDNVMDCTLWDGYSEQFLSFYNKRTDLGPAVVIIKHAKVKEAQGNQVMLIFFILMFIWLLIITFHYPFIMFSCVAILGVYPLQLCNVWNGTKLLFDPTIPEIAAFISRFKSLHTYMTT
jgi:hypothetical protein